MATFMTSIILYGFIAFVIGMIGKLIYEVQLQNKKEKEADELCKHEAEFEAKDRFQKLAGIGQPKSELDPEIWKYVADKVSREGFPEPDKSIPMTTATITTIGGSYGDSDPLASVPMSRVSKEAKKKMAEIAKEDINKQIEEKTLNIHPTNLHEIEKELDVMNKIVMGDGNTKDNLEIINTKIGKPKVRKSNPKQMDGIKTEGEFKKTRKKTTKKKTNE